MNKLRIKVITTLIEAVTEVMDSLATFGGRIVGLLDAKGGTPGATRLRGRAKGGAPAKQSFR